MTTKKTGFGSFLRAAVPVAVILVALVVLINALASGRTAPVPSAFAAGASLDEAVVRARKVGFVRFGRQADLGPEEARKLREKRIAALVRAGHDFDIARRVVGARTVEELEGWVAEARGEEQ